MEARGVGGFLPRDGEEDVRQAAGEPFHRERGGASPPWAGLVEQEAVAGVGDHRHAGRARGEAGEEAADGHVRVHQLGAFLADEPVERQESAALGDRREAAGQRRRQDAEAFGPHVGQKRAFGADAGDVVAFGAKRAHQGEEEVA